MGGSAVSEKVDFTPPLPGRPFPAEDIAPEVCSAFPQTYCGVSATELVVYYRLALGLKNMNVIRRMSPSPVRFVRVR